MSHVVNEESLRNLFSQFGNVVDAVICKSNLDQQQGRQSGYGFIHFPGTPSGIDASFRAAEMLVDVMIDDVNYKCKISHHLEKHLRDPMAASPPQSSLLSTSTPVLGNASTATSSLLTGLLGNPTTTGRDTSLFTGLSSSDDQNDLFSVLGSGMDNLSVGGASAVSGLTTLSAFSNGSANHPRPMPSSMFGETSTAPADMFFERSPATAANHKTPNNGTLSSLQSTTSFNVNKNNSSANGYYPPSTRTPMFNSYNYSSVANNNLPVPSQVTHGNHYVNNNNTNGNAYNSNHQMQNGGNGHQMHTGSGYSNQMHNNSFGNNNQHQINNANMNHGKYNGYHNNNGNGATFSHSLANQRALLVQQQQQRYLAFQQQREWDRQEREQQRSFYGSSTLLSEDMNDVFGMLSMDNNVNDGPSTLYGGLRGGNNNSSLSFSGFQDMSLSLSGLSDFATNRD
jgi:hypothetical protein